MAQEKDITVAALMTAPRYESTYARNQIERALKTAGIALTVSQGVFYGQCMQTMLADCVRHGVDYALTIDFDSLFTANDIHRLMNWIVERDDIDAIAAMQVARGKLRMLGTVPNGVQVGEDAKQVDWDGTPIRATTAHFGLTVIDCHKLSRVPKPWFHATPNTDGDWIGEKIDDDVSFWMAWKEAGNTLYIDPSTKIGHMEEMVAIHDSNNNAIHVHPTTWERMAYGH